MRRRFLGLVLTITLGAAGNVCAEPLPLPALRPVAQLEAAADSSENSVDWHGIYQGLLPCADCDGVETTLILRADHTYTLVRSMLGETAKTDEASGTFAWMADGGSIMLNDAGDAPDQYKVGENQIWQLDDQGREITGLMAETYILKKVGAIVTPPLEGVLWQLTELGGAPVPAPPEGQRRPYFVLSKDGKVQGFGGCNSFSGTYKAGQDSHFDLSSLISTMLACPEIETEGKLLQALEVCDRYQTVGNSLFLYQGDALLARFRAALERETD